MAPREPFPGIGNLLPGTNLVVLGTRSGLPPREPSTAKQLQSQARRALEDVLPLVELIAKGELRAEKLVSMRSDADGNPIQEIVRIAPDHGDMLKAAATLGKWAQVEVPEEQGGQRLTVHVHGGVSLGTGGDQGATGRPEAQAAIVEGLSAEVVDD